MMAMKNPIIWLILGGGAYWHGGFGDCGLGAIVLDIWGLYPSHGDFDSIYQSLKNKAGSS